MSDTIRTAAAARGTRPTRTGADTVSDTLREPLRFTFIEFNERRAMRGAPAARVDVQDPEEADGESGWLWMTRRDIQLNMKLHGEQDELKKALAAYGA